MSQVIGFRLDRSNPREAQALAVLNAWQEQGFSTRQIITEALLQLEDDMTESEISSTAAELQEVLANAHRLIERLQNGRAVAPVQPEQEKLAESFMLSVKNAAKSGVTLP